MDDEDDIPSADWMKTRAPYTKQIEDLRARITELEKDKARMDWLLSASRVYLFSPDEKNPNVGRYLADRDDIDAAMKGE